MTDVLFETPVVGGAPVPPATGPLPTPGGPPLLDVGSAGPVAGGEASAAGPVLEIHVVGQPAPQGSKHAFNNPYTGKAQMKESSTKTLAPWRQDVKQAALEAIAEQLYVIPADGVGVELDITFLMPRPKGHYGTGRNANVLKESAAKRPTTRPDIDKLLRSTLDALKVAGVYKDDANVVTVTGRKVYATGRPGAHIHVFTGDRP